MVAQPNTVCVCVTCVFGFASLCDESWWMGGPSADEAMEDIAIRIGSKQTKLFEGTKHRAVYAATDRTVSRQ